MNEQGELICGPHGRAYCPECSDAVRRGRSPLFDKLDAELSANPNDWPSEKLPADLLRAQLADDAAAKRAEDLTEQREAMRHLAKQRQALQHASRNKVSSAPGMRSKGLSARRARRGR